MKDSKKVLIFDFDGVIVDSIGIWQEHVQKTVPFYDEKMHSATLKSKWYSRYASILRHVFGILRLQKKEDMKQEHLKNKQERTPLYEGIPEAIKTLSESYTLTINTGAHRDGCVPILEKYDLLKYFEIIKSFDDAYSKEAKNRDILIELQREANDALYITDAVSDVVAAKLSGMRSIAVSWGVHDKEDFEGRFGDELLEVVSSPKELVETIDSWANG